MRYLGRTHGISVARLHEIHAGDNIKTVYEDTSKMAADIHTKSFTTAEAWTHAQELINIFDPKKLEKVHASNV